MVFPVRGPTDLLVAVCHIWNVPRWFKLILLAKQGLSFGTGRQRLDRFHRPLALINFVRELKIYRDWDPIPASAPFPKASFFCEAGAKGNIWHWLKATQHSDCCMRCRAVRDVVILFMTWYTVHSDLVYDPFREIVHLGTVSQCTTHTTWQCARLRLEYTVRETCNNEQQFFC